MCVCVGLDVCVCVRVFSGYKPLKGNVCSWVYDTRTTICHMDNDEVKANNLRYDKYAIKIWITSRVEVKREAGSKC